MSRWRRFTLLIALALVAASFATRGAPAAEPIVILISFDGWRWDYLDRLPVPNLRALASRGTRAAALIPSFPVLTFPNHYSIVTGLYPEHHGIVGNTMLDPSLPERFTMSSATAKESVWWGGEPLWVTTIRQGRRAATMFWPGTEAPIGGVRPTLWRPYDKQVPTPQRVAQALEWLALPVEQRPSFVSLYFEEVDSASHDHGIDSPEFDAAAAHLDAALGQLVDGVARLGLADRTTIVVVSDHGMTPLSTDRVIYLEDYVDPQTVNVTEWNAYLALSPKDGRVDQLYRRLNHKHPALDIYTRDHVPARLHFQHNRRLPAIVGIPRVGWAVTTRDRLAAKPLDEAAHGYEPRESAMRGLFVAAGPGIRSGAVLTPFENIQIYNFLCAVLGLTPAPNDGGQALAHELLVER